MGYESAKMDVHVIAYVYNWGRSEILRLPVNVRKEYVEFIRKQKEVENNQ